MKSFGIVLSGICVLITSYMIWMEVERYNRTASVDPFSFRLVCYAPLQDKKEVTFTDVTKLEKDLVNKVIYVEKRSTEPGESFDAMISLSPGEACLFVYP